MKILYALVVVAVVATLGFFLLHEYVYNEKQRAGLPTDHKNITFVLSGSLITLESGVHEEPVEGSAAKVTTKYFGNEARGDLNGDGQEDVVFLITQETGGSGILFYLVGAIKKEGGYEGTQAVFIGDRIAPQTTEFKDDLVIVNYAERTLEDSFMDFPKVGKNLYLKYNADSNDFGEVVQNFEGEVDREVVLKQETRWRWQYTLLNNGERVEPVKDVFVLTLNPNGTASSQTDCNSMSGAFVRDGEVLSFGPFAMTKMYCEGSQEAQYAEHLGLTTSLTLVKDQLHLNLNRDFGTMVFSRVH